MATIIENVSGVIAASGKGAILAPVQTLTDLKKIRLREVLDGTGVMVIDQQDFYIWLASTTITPDDVNVILPDEYDPTATTIGRWIKEVEKTLPSGVATLDGDGHLVQAASKVRLPGETLTWAGLSAGALVSRSGSTLAGVSTTSTITDSTDIPTAAAVKTYVEAQDAAQNEIHEITDNTVFLNSGKIGIGTSTPSSKLTVEDQTPDVEMARFRGADGSVRVQGGNKITFSRDSANYLTCTDAAGELYLETGGGGNPRITIKSDGKVGIGTTSPSDVLEISGNVSASTPTASTHLVTKAYCDAQSGGGGSSPLTVVTKTADYTVSSSDDVVYGDAGGSSIKMTLPAASTTTSRTRPFRVKNIGSSGSVTVETGGGNIDGSSSVSLSALQSLSFISDGSNYWIH